MKSPYPLGRLTRIFAGKKSAPACLITMGAVLLVSACSTIVNQSVAFNESDYSSSSTTGTAIIAGHAFVRSDTGAKHAAAGIPISLVPLTPYTEERAKIMESGKDPAPADPGLAKYVRTTVGDWGGSYKFEGLPVGNYLIFSRIKWERPFAGGMRRDASGDVYALARVQISNGEHKVVVVTNVSSN
ncbi:MAG TPA: hypothetical protein VGM64_15350 [Lacunisphaera sp.]|jgi:hypothetical protein